MLIVLILVSPLNFVSSQAGCSSLLPTRLSVGMHGRVVDGSPTNLRVGSSTRSRVIERMPSGTEFEIIRIPRCGWYRWWLIQLSDGTRGWAAEGDRTNYFLEPLPGSQAPTATPTNIQALTKDCTFTITAGNTEQLLRAINDANDTDTPDTLCLEAGTYLLSEVDNMNDENGPNALPIITTNITILGAEADTTSIERATNAAEFRIFEVAATGNLTLEGLHVARGNPGWVYYGGGIYNNGGIVTVQDSQIVGHHAVIGGAILNAGQLIIENSTFAGNSAENLGGAIANNKDAIISVHDSRFSDNLVTNLSNSGLYVGGAFFNNGTLNIINSILSENRAKDNASAIFNGGSLTIIGSCIFGNQVEINEAEVSQEIASVVNDADAAISALGNWWGTSDGPSGAGIGTGDAVSANVSFIPFLQQTECPIS